MTSTLAMSTELMAWMQEHVIYTKLGPATLGRIVHDRAAHEQVMEIVNRAVDPLQAEVEHLRHQARANGSEALLRACGATLRLLTPEQLARLREDEPAAYELTQIVDVMFRELRDEGKE